MSSPAAGSGWLSIHWYYLLPPLVGASFLKHKMFAMDMTHAYLELLLFIIPQSKYGKGGYHIYACFLNNFRMGQWYRSTTACCPPALAA